MRKADRPTDQQPTDRQADRPTDRQTDRPTDRQTDRPTDRQTDRPTDQHGAGMAMLPLESRRSSIMAWMISLDYFACEEGLNRPFAAKNSHEFD